MDGSMLWVSEPLSFISCTSEVFWMRNERSQLASRESDSRLAYGLVHRQPKHARPCSMFEHSRSLKPISIPTLYIWDSKSCGPAPWLSSLRPHFLRSSQVGCERGGISYFISASPGSTSAWPNILAVDWLLLYRQIEQCWTIRSHQLNVRVVSDHNYFSLIWR